MAEGVLAWVTAYAIVGDSAAPGGQLFQLVVLTVAANFGGWLISLTTLPRLIGMLLVGILFQVIFHKFCYIYMLKPKRHLV